MNSPEMDLAAELAELSATLNVALARIQSLAHDPAHVIRRESLVMDTLRATGPKVSAALRTLAERLESASCETAVFPNHKCGIESLVRPAVSGYAVVLRDTDADRTLPTVHRFATRDEAVAKARHLAGV
ncbi:MAG: hypothetical protein IAE82_18835 [Opitutaceae bacterium]|nr:hypothetical protein [Opitutaceae bacterium]